MPTLREVDSLKSRVSRMSYFTAVASASVLLMLCLVPAAAQDADGDGLPDSAEEQLGTDPNFAEQLDLIAEDPAGESKEADNYHPGLDITALYFGNIAKDRYLFRVDFLEDYHAQNSTFILYVNADNDPNTGRKDEGALGGTDFMIRPNGMSIIDAEGKYTSGPSFSAVVDGDLYLCADLPLNQVEGKSVFRARLLSESRDPYKAVDNTAWLDITGQGQSERRKVVRIADTTESENFDVTWGLDIQRAIRKDDRNVVLPIQGCELEGFEEDLFTEYHMPSAKFTGMPARVNNGQALDRLSRDV